MKRRKVLISLGCFPLIGPLFLKSQTRSDTMKKEIKTDQAPQASTGFSRRVLKSIPNEAAIKTAGT